MPEGDRYPRCFDPYLRYAISADFTNFELSDEKRAGFRIFLLVDLLESGTEESFARDLARAIGNSGWVEDGDLSVVIGPANDGTRYATLHAVKEAVLQAEPDTEVSRIWEEYVSRVELSLPLKPSLLLTDFRKSLERRWTEGQRSRLVGVLDDGCPFAAGNLLRTPTTTRVLSIWDQDQGKQPIPVKSISGTFGQVPTDFDYGVEFRRNPHVDALGNLQPKVGLDDWIQLHSTAAGSIDEDGCYADAKFMRLAPRQSHGAHVMDVLAGRLPTSSRVGPSPTWKPPVASDNAAKADVVFVQFPLDCIRDATGVWLKAYVLDGIRYILSFADPIETDSVMINISYGPTTGPHDGTAVLEEALTALVTEFDGEARKPKLEIFLAAGNTYLSRGHVAARQATQPDHIEWTWRLPPDNAVLCFAEIWMETSTAGSVNVTLTSPSGATSTSSGGPVPPVSGALIGSHTGVYAPVVWGNHTMWLLAIEPTILTAEHGDWKVSVAGVPADAEVHAYVARTDPNMGVRTGARRSYFVDHRWETTRSAAASFEYANGEFDDSGSLIRRYGTLNGIATAKHPSLHVAGGYNLADGNGRKSPYSSAGPARPSSARVGPDFALACDESWALGGIRAGGNRSGQVFRLIGTSAAAPQLARHFAGPPIPKPAEIPTSPAEQHKRGGGNIKPP